MLWWVFDRESAALRGWQADSTCPEPAPAEEPNAELNASRAVDRAVVLIDELDKADPDLPNALLVPLGSMAFEVSDIRERPVKVTLAGGAEPALGAAGQAMSRLLVVITTNEERELPPAFVRRCIRHRLEHPGWSDSSDRAVAFQPSAQAILWRNGGEARARDRQTPGSAARGTRREPAPPARHRGIPRCGARRAHAGHRRWWRPGMGSAAARDPAQDDWHES